MQTIAIEPFQVIGISVRTTNANGQSAQDIGALWQRFLSEGIAQKLPNKTSPEILCIYTNYEGDHTLPYDTFLGCKVSSLDEVPEGLEGRAFQGGAYTKVEAKGDLTKGIVYDAWVDIWGQDMNRTFTADFEVYGEKAQNREDAEVEIFVGVND
ncbi:MAG TPA: AraC family transcriptional regulator [Cytophagales bacterium]|nr:AraC family transcriptional regulator [Cytophagales bacterium]HAA20925.1 AraC family transcriptional regulator [Cytophagales bacterium]HAP58853.1 AraC family transcriptional regulator [Cytophagales bacterium]